MNATSLHFAPGLPWSVIAMLAALAGVSLVWAIWRGLPGWPLRAFAALVLLAALTGPSLQQEERDPLTDLLLVLEDDSASQSLSDRPAQNAAARDGLMAQISARAGVEPVLRTLSDLVPRTEDTDDSTRLMAALKQALAELPANRLAGVLLITDGVVHDLDGAPGVPVPMHAMISGRATDWDRRISVVDAPAFAILGEEIELRLKVETLGRAPAAQAPTRLSMSHDEVVLPDIPVIDGQDIVVPLTLQHAGRNLIHVTLPEGEGELTGRNNEAVIELNGVRDRLQVLLISGTPHPGTRTWRNLLKSDSAVDLVHFTILRPPEKRDGVPVNELSLIAFPTDELFINKIDEFDLIIFDRYQLRGILPSFYLASVRDYVHRGGAVLVAAGPSLAGVDSIARTGLADILPARPTGRLYEEPFLPEVTEDGQRHPITRDLRQFAPEGGWGPWMRQIGVTPQQGHVIMSAQDEEPLLIVDRSGEGRVALLASDHAWLWARGHQGGGPQLELLRRLAHWLMREPELEEEALSALATETGVTVRRTTMQTDLPDVTLIDPSGGSQSVTLKQAVPGVFEATVPTDVTGLFHVTQDDLSTVVVRGAATSVEFSNPLAQTDDIGPILAASNGVARRMEDGLPSLRAVRAGQPSAGRGWLGYVPRDAYVTTAIRLRALAPPALFLILAAIALVLAWLWEGRGGAAHRSD
ncbi:hypothetical protein SAMN04488030_0551 [Aliiroseovarius halocynthiae]|uniref:DUF7408 domain-containing protein n=1 Tax=Aliiroseovarius halocynthiae TaxID=985055 RepID=A0A545SU85_9RHOB|nr:hypothetical protein [Aliiroseovarius halocynthiae]TQV68529.1 hypothetical protein FIL88_02785 [Aliiroseovarius halocynthiae]SMR70932.1 hypothetical protein SAMN04488030_0551 [Aliiroseovarius halocynthiae]